MANANVNRIGQIAQAGDAEALFLKLFAGEVLTTYEQTTVTMDKHMVRSISNGKSASFPVTGKIGAEYHTPGAELLGLKVNYNERVLTIDARLVSHAFLDDVDEAMNHYDVRGPISKAMGEKLANAADEYVFRELILGARASALVSDSYGGTQLTDANFASATKATKAQALYDAIFAAAETFDEKNVPRDNRWCALRPAEYYTLVSAVQSSGFSVVHADYKGAGSIAEGKCPQIAGINLVMSNNVPSTDLSGEAYHAVDASNTYGIIWTPEGAGTVKLLDLAVRAEYDVRRMGTLLTASYAMGHGYLRPECCIELVSA